MEQTFSEICEYSTFKNLNDTFFGKSGVFLGSSTQGVGHVH